MCLGLDPILRRGQGLCLLFFSSTYIDDSLLKTTTRENGADEHARGEMSTKYMLTITEVSLNFTYQEHSADLALSRTHYLISM